MIADILGDDYRRFNHEFNLAKISYEERSLSSTRGSKVSDISSVTLKRKGAATTKKIPKKSRVDVVDATEKKKFYSCESNWFRFCWLSAWPIVESS